MTRKGRCWSYFAWSFGKWSSAAAVTVMGFGTDEVIQDNIVTGEDNWKDSWEGSISDCQE
jgi:hypothetical protein